MSVHTETAQRLLLQAQGDKSIDLVIAACFNLLSAIEHLETEQHSPVDKQSGLH